jgi:seryl-tRNA synthetase
MLDINFIRENADIVKAGAKKKHVEIDIDALLKLDDARRALTKEVDDMRAQQNAVSEKMPSATSSEREKLISEMKVVKEDLQRKEEQLKAAIEDWKTLMLKVPNVPDISVPEGDSDADNKEVRVWGEKTKFDFEPRSHVELLTDLGMVDTERGTKVAGFRGYFLTNDGARLVWALERFVQDRFIEKEGFTPMVVPSLMRREAFMGTGYLPQSEEDLYKTQDDLYLAGTAEVGMMGYLMGETIDKEKLPMKFFAFSPCFRREIGSYGKDTKGIFRIHEFIKYEQVVLCEANHEETVRHHEALTENSEKLLQELKLSYHVVVNCGGDLGLGQVKKYDLEAWMPSEKAYRETHSSSYFHDFQARRLGIRYKDTDGSMRFVHSLNNTALAMPRILCHIVENYQNEDGSVTIPEVLRPYMGGRNRITKS